MLLGHPAEGERERDEDEERADPKVHEPLRLAGRCYRLRGVVVHQGSYMGGHYCSYTRMESSEGDGVEETKEEAGESWCYATDHRVRTCEQREVAKRSAYILFYSSL